MKGKLIVIEGIDSSGKTTQLTYLQKFLEMQKMSFQTIDFPRYEETFYGKMIARFLQGDFGPLEQINPFLISVIFALDRKDAKEEMEQWLRSGELVICNRYATSNMAHQAGRVPKSKRLDFVKWNEELEYNVNQIPREDVVIFLDVPSKMAQKLMKNEKRKRSYNLKKDIVEKDTTYLQRSEETYQLLAKKFPHWVRVNCVNSKGQMRAKEDIHEEIKNILVKKGILR